ncbi:MAG: T9SS type A sorting domain-containing protein [Bacteroidota bacterium]|nr:T9SS type A sorting domain-containing protein [Bacteroidota bacterium]
MKNILFISLFFILSVSEYSTVVFAQTIHSKRSVLAIAGNSSIHLKASGNYHINYTIGQKSNLGTVSVENLRINQGYIQPEIIFQQVAVENEILDVILYPNPFENKLNIQITEEITDGIYIQITDIHGRKILSAKYNCKRNITLQLRHISCGQYIIHITSGNKNFISTLIKQK